MQCARRSAPVESNVQIDLAYLYTGAAGTGRTTFVNTLCDQEVLAHKSIESPETANIESVLSIKPVNVGKLDYCTHVTCS